MTTSAGRRPGDPEITRKAILAAAIDLFQSVGFDRATIRAIAARAEVDPALVHHYFTNKHQLFVAAHELPIDPSKLFAAVAELPVAERGAVLVSGYLQVFASPGSTALSLLRGAATNDSAAAMLRGFIDQALIEHAPQIIEGPRPELRMALIGSHLVGIAFARELVGIEPLRDTEITDLVAVVAPVIQHYIE